MISLQDCIDLCGLTEEEVRVAEHEHIPEIVAASLGQYMLHQKHGPARIRDMIGGDIRGALDRKDIPHASELVAVMQHFLSTHPEVLRLRA